MANSKAVTMGSLSKLTSLAFEAILLMFAIHPSSANSRKVSSSIHSSKYMIDMDHAKHHQSIKYSFVFDKINIIRLEDNANASIGTVSKIQIVKNTIIILDKNISKSIFTFDMSQTLFW